MKTSQKIIKFNSKAYKYAWKPSQLSELRVIKLLDMVGTGKLVLDVGCFDGQISNRIKMNGNQVVGVDISPSAVKLAKKNHLEAYVYNLEEQEIPKYFNKFDVVIAGEIIEHIFDTDVFIEKINKFLKRNGSLVLSTPNLAGLGSRLSLFIGHLPWMVENDLITGKSGHIRYFTYRELVNLLVRHGFKVETFTTDSVGLGSITVPFLDKLFPTLGRILIVKARKV